MKKNEFWESMDASPSDVIGDEEDEYETSTPVQLTRDMPVNKTRYSLQLGYRTNEIGHPTFPWPSCVDQQEDGRVLIDLNKWHSPGSGLPALDKSTPFPFPFSALSSHFTSKENTDQWHYLMICSIHMPFFVYTPPVFLLLNSVAVGREKCDEYWQMPVQLTTDMILCYHQVMSMLGKGNTRSPTVRREILKAYESFLAGAVAKLLKVIRADKDLKDMFEADEPNPRGMEDFARYIASHTIIHMKNMEAAILRLSGLDDLAPESPIGKLMFTETALPDPEDDRIAPFSAQLMSRWQDDNTDYIGCKYENHKQEKPEVQHVGNIRGIHMDALWHLFRLLMNERAFEI